jgi:hypothetical protein
MSNNPTDPSNPTDPADLANSATPSNDPRTQPAPAIFVDRIEALARDLAYGARLGDWAPVIYIDASLPSNEYWSSDGPPICSANLATYLDTKWPYDEATNQFPHPSYSFLEAWDYFTYKYQSGSAKGYLLTPKAFALLEKPSAPPAIFISYSRKDGSVFALLIEARLRLVGVPNPFVDKNLVPGETWLAVLKERIQACKYFVCIVGVESLNSPHVQKEIAWAIEAGCTVISIWHDTSIDDVAPSIKQLPAYQELSSRQIITVKGNTADDYESAVNKLLNAMGYPTY